MKIFFLACILLLTVTCASTQNTSPHFKITSIKVCNAPGSLETADFNKDGLPDLVVASETDSSVTILLSSGNGKFQPAPGSPFHAGQIPNDVTVKDLNNDSNVDLIIANHEKKQVTILNGDGLGGFTQSPYSPFRTKGIPHTHGVAIGDFNKDGLPDLVTDSWGNDQLEVFFGDVNKLFINDGKFLQVGKRPYQRHRVADVNGDGADDIVATNMESNNATVLLSDGTGGFFQPAGSPFPCGDAPFGLAIGDVNGDGRTDRAIINSPSSSHESKGLDGLTILLGDGAGGFRKMKGSPFVAGRTPNRIAIGDVNGDGVNDIVTSAFEDNKIFLFLMSKRESNVTGIPVETGNHPKGLAIVDLNNDGREDVIVCNNADNSISILISN